MCDERSARSNALALSPYSKPNKPKRRSVRYNCPKVVSIFQFYNNPFSRSIISWTCVYLPLQFLQAALSQNTAVALMAMPPTGRVAQS